MLIELAQFCLIFAMLFSLAYAGVLLFDSRRETPSLLYLIQPGIILHWLLLFVPYAILTYSFIVHDFSLSYVARHSTLEQPLIYRIAAVWGAHEGSLLFWVLVQATWALLVSVFSQSIPKAFIARVLAILSLLNTGILSFMLFTSNPFERINPQLVVPQELNPLLQDPGLAFHPPLLYIGYIGFSVAFAFAISVLLSGQFSSRWALWVKPWTIAAWCFLTLGITLGSLWAYYELGWGGWWFWDPVENASLMPWLVGTALIHSLTVTEKRKLFLSWSLLLAISAYSLSLLGTFLVRSGIITSVHAFASDPERGLFILSFLALVIGSALLLYSLRAGKLQNDFSFSLLSRESGLLLNTLFLSVFTFTVLLGTLFPLLYELLDLGKISVGAPYFNAMFTWILSPLAILLGLSSLLRWTNTKLGYAITPATVITGLSLIIATLHNHQHFTHFSFLAFLGIVLSCWILLWTMWGVYKRIYIESDGQRRQAATFWGMNLAHLGIAVLIFGITTVSHLSTEKHLVMQPGDNYQLQDYSFQFEKMEVIQLDNFLAQQGQFAISTSNKQFQLYPQKRFYQSSERPMTEAAINSNLFRDIYISLGEPLSDDIHGPWSIRLYYKPSIMCIWLAGFLMALGGVISIADKRYKRLTT